MISRSKIVFLTLVILAAAAVTIWLANYPAGEEARKVNLSRRAAPEVIQESSVGSGIRFAVGAMLTPREGFVYYRRLLDYIAEELGQPVRLIDRESYAEINDLLKTGNLDAAFVCSGPYVDGHDEFGLELLAVPVAYGRRTYNSYIIVNEASAIDDLEGLSGKTFAFTDPNSNTGKIVPTYLLATMNETPDTFFEKYIFTYAHDKSILAVAEGIVDGAAVDSLIWEYADRTNDEHTSKTKIIWRSPPYGIPPVVVRPGLDGEIKGRIRTILLNIHQSDRGRDILAHMMIDRFGEGEDSDYDTIREMESLTVAGGK